MARFAGRPGSRLAVTRGAGGAWPTMMESAASRCALEGDIHMQPPRAPTSGQEGAPVEIQPPRVVFVRAGTHAPTTDAPALPGSKYYTLRYLLNALLAAGENVVHFPVRSDDAAGAGGGAAAAGRPARLGRGGSGREVVRRAPLVRATLGAVALAGIGVEEAPDLRWFRVAGGQTFAPRDYLVPGDGPSAAALLAAALALDVPLRLHRLPREEDDVRALLAALGALGVAPAVEACPVDGLCTLALGRDMRPRGAVVDGDACIDSVPALVAAACFAEGESRFENVATLRLKESDRIGDLCLELRRAGCAVGPLPDAIVVRGRPEGIAGGVR